MGGMTDIELKRREAICEVAGIKDIGELSDGFHTFNSLYKQRMILFAALVRAYKDKAWKSYRHEDGEYCFGGGWFIVGIDTPEGSYTYHYENKYWDMFDCVDLPRSPHWDGHTELDAETRLMSLEPELDNENGDLIRRQTVLRCIKELRDNIDWGQSEDGDAFLHYTGTLYRSIASGEYFPSVKPERAIKDCRNCKYGNYNDHYGTYFCYHSGDCNDFDKWEPSVKPEQEDYTEMKREFLRMASYIDAILECSDEQKETLLNFISRLAEFMPWTERD